MGTQQAVLICAVGEPVVVGAAVGLGPESRDLAVCVGCGIGGRVVGVARRRGHDHSILFTFTDDVGWKARLSAAWKCFVGGCELAMQATGVGNGVARGGGRLSKAGMKAVTISLHWH